jgi:hypothetical protein
MEREHGVLLMPKVQLQNVKDELHWRLRPSMVHCGLLDSRFATGAAKAVAERAAARMAVVNCIFMVWYLEKKRQFLILVSKDSELRVN